MWLGEVGGGSGGQGASQGAGEEAGERGGVDHCLLWASFLSPLCPCALVAAWPGFPGSGPPPAPRSQSASSASRH